MSALQLRIRRRIRIRVRIRIRIRIRTRIRTHVVFRRLVVFSTILCFSPFNAKVGGFGRRERAHRLPREISALMDRFSAQTTSGKAEIGVFGSQTSQIRTLLTGGLINRIRG